MNEQLKQEVVKEVLNILGNYDRIPYNVQEALGRRLGLDSVPSIGTSVKTVGSATQAVNEAGSSSYNVAKVMSGFKTLTDGAGNQFVIATY